MFVLAGDEDDEPQGLKPMNCPGHCIVFGHRARSFRELPLRMAEFGVLHRNEDSGALTGLSRVRKFVQDDAHLFCTQDQVKDEVMGCLDLMKTVYGLFHFAFDLELSTRPAKYMGELEVWDRAERELAEALDAYAGPGKWKTNAGDGAFYGPKIDIHVRDAIGRSWQTATVQLDFQLPISFNLRYLSEKGEMERPVIVHRAILGSIERFMGILIEHVAGLWPLWLSPRQVAVLTVVEADELVSYAHEVGARFTAAGFDVDVDVGGDTIKRKIRNAVVRHYNYIFVVGKSEVKNRTINVRSGRSNEVLGEKSIDDMIADLKARVDRHE
jgi:threonyl-tRNA synthetase